MAAEPIEVWVPGNPVAKGRPRFTTVNGKPKAYTPKKTRIFEELVAFFAHNIMQERGLQPLTCPVALDLVFNLPIPSGWSNKRTQEAISGQIAHTKNPDLSNLEKSIEDGLNGVAWTDDKLIVSCTKRKRYAPVWGVHIKVIPLDLDIAPK